MRRKLIAGSAVVAAVIAGLTFTTVHAQAGTEPAANPPELTLPEPTGAAAVGYTAMHLVDEERADPWVPEKDRELMVSMWYPARTPSDEPVEYVTPQESRLYLASQPGDLPPDALTTVGTNATVDAKAVKATGQLPLVVLSPGFSLPRATVTSLAEDLASRGYVVAGIGHNYEAAGITFPNGETTTCVACDVDDEKKGEKVIAARAADASFVIDSLTAEHPRWKDAKLIDEDNIAMGGHSIGGAAAVAAILGDSRIKAGFNMDGSFHHAEDLSVDEPFLMLGAPDHAPGLEDDSWDTTYGKMTDWKRWLTVDDTTHSSFTDLAWLAEQLDVPIQELDGERCIEITRDYVGAFVDLRLREEDSPILDGETPENPEVRFHRP